MDDMENKLGAILNNPQMMQQIAAMAQSFQQSEQPKEQPQAAPAGAFPELDLSMIQKLSGFARQSGVDKNQQSLLKALGPYLSHQRISKLERAMRAAKMAGMASAFLSTTGR